MRVYVLGDVRADAVRLANAINATEDKAIICETERSGWRELVEELLARRSHDFDLTVIISKQPVDTSIEVNRTERFRATVCRDAHDAVQARHAHANVMVLDGKDFDGDDAAGIIKAWSGATSHHESESGHEDAPAEREYDRRSGILPSIDVRLNLDFLKSRRHKPRDRDEKRERDEEEERLDEPKGKGIMERIKYTFGIE